MVGGNTRGSGELAALGSCSSQRKVRKQCVDFSTLDSDGAEDTSRPELGCLWSRIIATFSVFLDGGDLHIFSIGHLFSAAMVNNDF